MLKEGQIRRIIKDVLLEWSDDDERLYNQRSVRNGNTFISREDEMSRAGYLRDKYDDWHREDQQKILRKPKPESDDMVATRKRWYDEEVAKREKAKKKSAERDAALTPQDRQYYDILGAAGVNKRLIPKLIIALRAIN